MEYLHTHNFKLGVCQKKWLGTAGLSHTTIPIRGQTPAIRESIEQFDLQVQQSCKFKVPFKIA